MPGIFPPIHPSLTRGAGRRFDELILAIEDERTPYHVLSDRERVRYLKALRFVKNEVLDLIADAHEDGQNVALMRAIDVALTVHEERGGGDGVEVADRLRVLSRGRIGGKDHTRDGALDDLKAALGHLK